MPPRACQKSAGVSGDKADYDAEERVIKLALTM